MALADPQTITINTVANTLPRTSSGTNSGAFTKDDGNVALSVAHQYGKRTRRAIRIDHKKVAPDPLVSAQNILHSMSASLVVNVPVTGYTVTEAKQIVDGFIAALNASSGALITKVLGGES
jgi:hypothetical protein